MSAVTVIERELDLDRCVPPAVLAREGKACLGNDLPTVSELNAVADKPIQLANDAEIGIPSEDLREFLDVVKGQDQKGGKRDKRRRRQRGGDEDDDALAEYTPRQRAVATGLLMSCGIAGGAWAMGGLEISALGAFGSLEKLLVATKMAVPPCREKSAIDRTLQDKAMASVGMPSTTSCSAIGDEYEQALKRMWATSVGLLAIGGLTWRKAWKKLQLSVLRRLGSVSERFMTPSQIEAQMRGKEEQEQKMELGTRQRKMEFERNLARQELKHKREMAAMKRDMESLERGEMPPTPRSPSDSPEEEEEEEPKAPKGKGKGKGKATAKPAARRAPSPQPTVQRRSARLQGSRDPSAERPPSDAGAERGAPLDASAPPASPRPSGRDRSGYSEHGPPSAYNDPRYDMQGYRGPYDDPYQQPYAEGYEQEYGYPEDLGDEGPAMPRSQRSDDEPSQGLRRSARNRSGRGGAARKTRRGRAARRTRKAGVRKAGVRKGNHTRKADGKRKGAGKRKASFRHKTKRRH